MVAKSKAELKECIKINFDKIFVEFSKVSNDLDLINLKELEGNISGTKISIRDNLCYLIGWAELVLNWYKLGNSGKEVIMPEVGFKWNNLGLLAEKLYGDYSELNYFELLIKFEKTVDNILELVEFLSEKELFEVGYFDWSYDKWDFARLIEINTSSPYKSNRTKIRKFLKNYNLL